MFGRDGKEIRAVVQLFVSKCFSFFDQNRFLFCFSPSDIRVGAKRHFFSHSEEKLIDSSVAVQRGEQNETTDYGLTNQGLGNEKSENIILTGAITGKAP